jgi:hypothetical protein
MKNTVHQEQLKAKVAALELASSMVVPIYLFDLNTK